MDREKIKTQLDQWRQKLDLLRVRGNLLKMEYRDKQDEVVDQVHSAYNVAKQKFDELTESGEAEAEKLGAGFQAAWTAFKDAYNDVTVDE